MTTPNPPEDFPGAEEPVRDDVVPAAAPEVVPDVAPQGSQGLTTAPQGSQGLTTAPPPLSAEPLPVEPASAPAEATVEQSPPVDEPLVDGPEPAPVPVVAETATEPELEPEAEPALAPPPRPARSRAWLPLTAVGLAVALLAGSTGWLAWQLRQQDRADRASVDAVAAARDAARLLFSYDHATLQADFAKGLTVTTGEFRSQYQRTTKDVVTPVATQYKAVVLAEVVEAAVIEARADEVTALVFLNQATTSTRVEGQQVDQSRVRMRLVPRDGRWLVEEVKAL